MYKVIIIDDEPMIIQSIKSGINWEKLNLELVYTATDSRQALDYAKENSIDIVISDISMPPFNGLTLCSEIAKIDSSIQFIIISGFADFSYAKKAIQIGAIGYCLKPIDYTEMMTVLKLAVDKIEPKNDFMEYDFMEYVYENNVDGIQKFLIGNKIKDRFHMIIVIGKENLSKHIKVKHLMFNIGINKYLYILNEDIDELILTKVKDNPLIEGIGMTTNEVSYNNLLEHIDDVMVKSYHFFFCKDNKVFMEDTNRQDEYYNKICKDIDKPTKLKEDLIKYLRIPNKGINIKQAMKLHNMILNKYRGPIGEEDDLNIYSFDELVRSYESFDNMIKSLLVVMENSFEKNDMTFESYNKNFIKVIKYINKNFTKNISIKDIAEELFLNPNYISQLFKKETGTTYVKYLTGLRIEKAKELLIETDMSINEVCINSGFNDYFYFIKKFKKYNNVTPSYYRKSNI